MSPELERLIGKAVMDKDFRKKVMSNLDEALKEAGISLSDDEKTRVSKATKDHAKEIADAGSALDAAKGGTW
jgi:hypothetical protein